MFQLQEASGGRCKLKSNHVAPDYLFIQDLTSYRDSEMSDLISYVCGLTSKGVSDMYDLKSNLCDLIFNICVLHLVEHWTSVILDHTVISSTIHV